MPQLNPSYVFIGDIKSKKIMTEYSLEQSIKQHHKDANIIFEKQWNGQYHLNQRNQLKANGDGDYYYIVTEPSLFFLVFAKSGNETTVFKMIDNINQEHIPLMTNDIGELNAQGRQALKGVIGKWQSGSVLNQTSEIQEVVNSIRIDIKDNIDQIVNNIDGLDELQNKSEKIKEIGKAYKDDANTLQKVTWWKNCKLIIIIALIVIVLILVIILPIVLKK